MPVLSSADVYYQTQHISDDKSKQILAICVVSSCVASVAVALRIIARRVNQIETSLQADDYMIIIGFVLHLEFHRQATHTVADISRPLLLLISEDNSMVSQLTRIQFCFSYQAQAFVLEWGGILYSSRNLQSIPKSVDFH